VYEARLLHGTHWAVIEKLQADIRERESEIQKQQLQIDQLHKQSLHRSRLERLAVACRDAQHKFTTAEVP